jgi:hypothetical protein
MHSLFHTFVHWLLHGETAEAPGNPFGAYDIGCCGRCG